MTTTVKEEFAEVVSSCEEVLAEQSRLEELIANDFEAINQMVRRFERSRGNQPVTAEEARALALHVRQAMNWNQVNAQGTRILMLLVLQVSLLAQQDGEMKVETPANMEKALRTWFEQWEAAKKAWNQYTQ